MKPQNMNANVRQGKVKDTAVACMLGYVLLNADIKCWISTICS